MFKPETYKGKLFGRYISMQNHPSKIRIQNLAGKLLFRDGIALSNEDNIQLRLDANDWITRTIMANGGYEEESVHLAKKLLGNGGVFIDAGANFGLFTCLAAAKGNSIVYAIEPNFKIMPRLLHHVKINKMENRVHILNVALSSQTEFVTIDQVVENNLGTTVTKAGVTGLISVLSCPLQMILDHFRLDEIQLLKMDIEGNEFSILENFPFERYSIHNIIMEFNHLSPVSFQNLINFFISKSYIPLTVNGDPLLTHVAGIPENNIWFAYQNVNE